MTINAPSAQVTESENSKFEEETTILNWTILNKKENEGIQVVTCPTLLSSRKHIAFASHNWITHYKNFDFY